MLRRLLSKFLARKNVVYDDTFFREEWFRGWRELAPVLGNIVAERPDWHRILDFGCGPGAMIDPMRAAGIDYIGCDYSREAHALYLEYFGNYPDAFKTNLADIKGKVFDLFLSFDVFEHMTDGEISDVLDVTKEIPFYLVNISRDWRTPGHINIKSDRAWIRFFVRRGLTFDETATSHLRAKYLELRPGGPDRWERNMFVLSRISPGKTRRA